MTSKRVTVVGITASVLAPLGFFVLVGVLLWAPEPHDVHTPGAAGITSLHIARGDPSTTYLVGRLPPSLSLADMQCQAWQSIASNASRPCPDAATPEQKKYWPGEAQRPNTLYVWLPRSCLGYPGTDYSPATKTFNVEYTKSSRTLVIHCYSSAPRLELPTMHLGGVQMLVGTDLLVVATDQIGPGNLAVVEDDRVERLFGDRTSQVELGTVAIS